MNVKKIITSIAFACAAPFACAEGFTLVSADITDGMPLQARHVLSGFGCTGNNLSPQLTWRSPPAGTKSYAITVFDPDAPTGSGWWHWTVANIPAAVQSLERGAGNSGGPLPAGAMQGRTDFGHPGYGGACPPAGNRPHRYEFTIWALKVASLPLDAESSGAMFGLMLRANALGHAQITATFGR